MHIVSADTHNSVDLLGRTNEVCPPEEVSRTACSEWLLQQSGKELLHLCGNGSVEQSLHEAANGRVLELGDEYLEVRRSRLMSAQGQCLKIGNYILVDFLILISNL